MPISQRKGGWGDDDEEEEYETPVDERTGLKQRVRVQLNNKGQKVRITQTIKVSEKKIRIPKRVLERRNLPKFGDATLNDTNVTIVSKDLVTIEHPDDALVDGEDDATLGGTLQNFILKQKERQFERELDLDGILGDDSAPRFRPSAKEDGEKEDDSDKNNTTGKYVPPSARGGATARASSLDNAFKNTSDRDHENTLRVSNLTKAVTEDDLRELFGRFGPIHRISLPRAEKIENGRPIKEPRGFAYVAFHKHEDAEAAMERLQGYGYDHLILKLEWAKPPFKDAGAESGLGRGHVSGYGQKLAQDTKEAVLYASNLTGNR